MIPILIFLASVAALAQFFLSYVRAILLAGAQQCIAPQLLETCSLDSSEVTAADFHRLMLRVYLLPDRRGEGTALFAVRIYFLMVGLLRLAFGPLVPVVRNWSAGQQAACARFALASLDRRLITRTSASA